MRFRQTRFADAAGGISQQMCRIESRPQLRQYGAICARRKRLQVPEARGMWILPQGSGKFPPREM
jgi:hypothetical protein